MRRRSDTAPQNRRAFGALNVFGRLKEGATAEQAAERLRWTRGSVLAVLFLGLAALLLVTAVVLRPELHQ